VLLQDKDIAHGKAENTVEFHWYSAEEGGLLGSQAIFSAYEKQGRDVKAMYVNKCCNLAVGLDFVLVSQRQSEQYGLRSQTTNPI
jgi:hypothetical protein